MTMPNPTLYDPKYCDEIVAFMQQGYSIGAFAGSILVHRATLYRWREDHPDFDEAMKIGQAARTYKLEVDLLSAQNPAVVRSRAYALKNADPIEWRDKREIEHSAPGGAALPGIAVTFVKAGDAAED
jgi:hypothetical protein